MGETGGDVSPGGGVVLMTLGGPPPPPEPQGVPPKQLEELLSSLGELLSDGAATSSHRVSWVKR